MAYTFHGGTHPDDKKAATNKKAIEPMKAPEQVVLPVSMHIGAPAKPVVQKGGPCLHGPAHCGSQRQRERQRSRHRFRHSGRSGAPPPPQRHPGAGRCHRQRFQDEPDPSLHPLSMEAMTPEQMTEVVKEAGIVGHGGATSPPMSRSNRPSARWIR